MKSIFQLFWRICLFRDGPETIPANNVLLLLTLIANAGMNIVVQLAWGGETVTRFVITMLTLWSLAVYGFIFHRALNIHIALGIGMALFVVVFSMAITQTALAT